MSRSSRWKWISYYRYLLLVLVVQATALTSIVFRTSPTEDEYGHLPSGLWHLQFGDFTPYRVNPPLVRCIAALPVLLAGGSIDNHYMPESTGARPEIPLAHAYGRQMGSRVFSIMRLARIPNVLICLLGSVVLWRIARRRWGRHSANLATTLWATSPMVLTYGATIVPDVPATVAGLAAIDAFARWHRTPALLPALGTGLLVGIALACKTTWIILPPLLVVLLFCKRGRWISRLTQSGCMMVLALLVLHAVYDFRGSLQPIGDFEFVSDTLTDSSHRNLFAESWLGDLPSPLPQAMLEGIDIQLRDFEGRYPSYLFGQWRQKGWWYYYLVGIGLKEPVAIWLMLGLTFNVVYHQQNNRFLRLAPLAAPGIAVLLVVSLKTGMNHHLRYALPFLPVLYLAASFSPKRNGRFHSVWISYFLAGCYAASSLAMLPRSYAFFTEAIGGTTQGWKYIGDSNLDWGQDLPTLRSWLAEQPETSVFYILYSIEKFPVALVDERLVDGHLFLQDPDSVFDDRTPTAPGTWIVFARAFVEPRGKWFQRLKPQQRLSPSIAIYSVADGNLHGSQ